MDMKDENQEHPSPEVLVDLVEGDVVDAVWVDHLASCKTCADEVESLRRALETASTAKVPEPGEAYWDGFNSRLKNRIDGERKGHLKLWVWAAAAAAVIAVGFWASPYWMGVLKPSPAVTTEILLPPVEDDEEYQALLAFAEILTDSTTWTEVFEDPSYSGIDPSQLTADETEELRSKLEKDIEDLEHAKF
jgi:hypothetical protein